MTRIRGGQMAPHIDHNSTVHLIKMTLSRTAQHILQGPVQNSKAAVRKGFFILYRLCAVILIDLPYIRVLHNHYVFSTLINLVALLSNFFLKQLFQLFSRFNGHSDHTVANRSTPPHTHTALMI